MSAADVAAILAGLPAVAILTYRARAIRRATLLARSRHDRARDEYAAAVIKWHRARITYRQERRDAIRNYHRAAAASRRDRRAIRAARRYERTVQLLTYKERTR